MPITESDAFKTAIADSEKLTRKPDNDALLQLYALFKVGKGVDIESSPTPGIFDLKAKAKRAAWQEAVDQGTTPEQAQEDYATLVEDLKKKHGYKA